MQKRYQTVSLELDNGANVVTEKKQIDPSDRDLVIAATVYPEPTEDIAIEVKHNGSTLTDSIPVTFLDGKLGPIEDRGVSIPSKGNANLEVIASSKTGATKDYKIEVLFVRVDNNGTPC